MAFVGLFTGIGLELLRVPGALGLGIVAGVLTFVEYLGAVVSAIPAVFIAFTIGWTETVWVILVYLVVHIVEGYVLTPLIARAAVRIPPAYTLAGQIALGGLFGVLGLTFATPLAVVVVVLVNARRSADARSNRATDSDLPEGSSALDSLGSGGHCPGPPGEQLSQGPPE
jgi:predicted PurR-regulated permease PerM